MEKNFKPNTDLFGWYAEIKTNFNQEMFLYKVISCIESNAYCDIPILYNSEPTLHKDMTTVLKVICCGIDETKVERVALKDCRLINPKEVTA